MSPELFAEMEIPDEIEDLEDLPPEYGSSFRFDFERGEFVVQGGRVAVSDGYEAWAEWCVKAVKTERFVHLAYSDEYGAEIDAVGEQDTRAEAETLLENTIIDTLEADPRTSRVTDFLFEWEGDKLRVTCTIEPTLGAPTAIEVSYTGWN